MNNAKIRKWLIAIMVCACSSVGMAQIDSGVSKPVVDSSRWIVKADAQSVDVGISRYILRLNAKKDGMNIFVMGNLERMAWVKMDETNGISSMCITMLSTGNQLDFFTGLNSIDVGWNSMTVLSVDDGEVTGSMDGILELAAIDVMYALTHDQNLRAHFAQYNSSKPSFGYDCAYACRIEYPRPGDCIGSFDELACCSAEAYYDHCRRACQCSIDYPGVWQTPVRLLCEDLARAMLIYEGLRCGVDWVL